MPGSHQTIFGTSLKEEASFVQALGFDVHIFGKKLDRYLEGHKDCDVFIVVTRSRGDELCYPQTLKEPHMSRLSNLISCGYPASLHGKWKLVQESTPRAKVYLAGEEVGVDCTSVADDMFFEEEGKKYTFAVELGAKDIVVEKIEHPHEILVLFNHFSKLWRAAKDFSEVCELNRKFVKGEIGQTPYCGGALSSESAPLVEGLLKLHDFQLITDCSQPYEHSYKENEDKTYWIERLQRPYVTFIMQGGDGSKAPEFFKMLKKRLEIIISAANIFAFSKLPGSHGRAVVTYQRCAKMKKDLATTKWEDLTWSMHDRDFSTQPYYNFRAIKRSNPIAFDVAARNWYDPVDLLGIVEEVAVRCGLPCAPQTVTDTYLLV